MNENQPKSVSKQASDKAVDGPKTTQPLISRESMLNWRPDESLQALIDQVTIPAHLRAQKRD